MSEDASTIPNWVPNSVAEIGVRVPCLVGVRTRLLTDVRMKAVWREIAQNPPDKAYLSSIADWRRLKSWDLDERNCSATDIACAALFAFAAVKFSRQPHVWTTTLKQGSKEEFESAAQVCQAFAHDSMMASSDEQMALQRSADFLMQMSRTVDALEGPQVLDKDARLRSDLQVRVHARELAVEMRRLFGKFLYGTVAKLVTVGLETPRSITLKSVSNWCADLRKGIPQHREA